MTRTIVATEHGEVRAYTVAIADDLRGMGGRQLEQARAELTRRADRLARAEGWCRRSATVVEFSGRRAPGVVEHQVTAEYQRCPAAA